MTVFHNVFQLEFIDTRTFDQDQICNDMLRGFANLREKFYILSEQKMLNWDYTQVAINVIAIKAERTPIHCLAESLSFKINQASITVVAGYIEEREAAISSLPVLAANV